MSQRITFLTAYTIVTDCLVTEDLDDGRCKFVMQPRFLVFILFNLFILIWCKHQTHAIAAQDLLFFRLALGSLARRSDQSRSDLKHGLHDLSQLVQ